MDSRNGNAAAAPLLQHPPHALLALPDLDRPPAVLEMRELEAVAAALPAKKRRLRETFDRLAAAAPLPFRWEDLDTYISSLQYSVTLRHRQLREPDRSRPVPALAPAPAAVSSAAGDDDAHQMRALEPSRPVHIPVPIPLAVSEPAATGGDAHVIRVLEESESAPAAAPAPADDSGLAAAEPNASADATAQVEPVPVSKIAVVPQGLPGPATAARPASNASDRARPAGRLPPQRSRPLLRIPGFPASTAVSAAPVPCSQKTQMQNTPHDDGEAKGSPCRPDRGTGTGNGLLKTAAVTPKEPICKIAGVRHGSPAATPQGSSAASPTKVASFSLAKVPKQEPQDIEEVPDVEMEIVEAEEVQPFKEDAPVADGEASSPPQAKAHEADKVSPLPLACSDGGLAQPGARAATVTQEDAAGATAGKSSPGAVTRDAPNVLQTGAPKSAGVRTATRDAASDVTRLAPAAGSQNAAAEVSPVPPRRGNGLAQSGVSTDDAMQTVAACKGAVAAGRASPATDLVPARGRNATGPSRAMAPPKASNNKHVLQKQHMPKQDNHEPIHPAQKQNHSFSWNNGGRPAGSSQPPVPEAQAATAQWSKPGEGRGGGPGHGGFAAARWIRINNIYRVKSAKRKKRSLAKSASTSNPQQQHNKKHKKKQEHHGGQESQQQGQPNELGEKLEEKLDKQEHHEGQESQQQGQQSKPGEKLEEKLDKEELHKGQESQQQGKQSKPGEKLEEKLDKEELHKGQESQQQGKQSKPGEKLEQKLDKPQQKQQQKKQDKLQGKQQQSKQQHVKWERRCTPKLPAPASSTVRNAPLRGHFGHPPYAAIHGVHHSYPAQAGWPGVPCVPPPFAPQLGAPEYIIPFNPFYPHPEFYPW